MKAFVTGGSGFVGKRFIEYILQKQPEYASVVALSRSEKADQTILQAIGQDINRARIARGDLHNVGELVSQLKGCDVVFHVAAKVDLWGKWEDFMEANVTGTQNLLTAAKQAGVKKFVHVSTEAAQLTGFYNGCLLNIDESAPLSFDPPFYAPYTKSKAMAEKLVIDSNDSAHNFTTVVVKPRLVWGKGDTKVIPELKRAMLDGRFKWFTPTTTTSTCHVENLCEGMILAASKGKPGSAYFLTDGEGPVIFNDFVKKLVSKTVDCDSIGSFSSTIAWYVAIIIENIPFMGYGVDREPLLNRQVLGLIAQDVIVKDDKARKELGYTSHMSMERGIQEFVESETS